MPFNVTRTFVCGCFLRSYNHSFPCLGWSFGVFSHSTIPSLGGDWICLVPMKVILCSIVPIRPLAYSAASIINRFNWISINVVPLLLPSWRFVFSVKASITEQGFGLVEEKNRRSVEPRQLEDIANHLFRVAPPLGRQAARVQVEERRAADPGQGSS